MAFPNQIKTVAATAYVESGTDTAWVNLANTIDGSDTTFAGAGGVDSNLPGLSYANNLVFSGFDFSWFDNTLYDVTGVKVLVGSDGDVSSVSFYEGTLVDESGLDLGANMGGVANEWPLGGAGPVGVQVNLQEQLISIPYATYSSPNFGVRLRAYNNQTGMRYARIYFVELVLMYKRKEVISNYGVEIYNADGTLKFAEGASYIRKIDEIAKAGGYTGVISIPDFDDTKGVFFFYSDFEKFDLVPQTEEPKTSPWSNQYLIMNGHGLELPATSWNNTTKEVTASTSTVYPLPVNFEDYPHSSSGWIIVPVHYR